MECPVVLLFFFYINNGVFMVSTVEVYLISEFQDTSSRGWHLDISNWLDRRLRLFHNRCKSQKMGVGLGLYICLVRKAAYKQSFLLPVIAAAATPKGRYWHHSRKVCPNGWLPPHEVITPLPSTLNCFKRTQRALWLMIQGTFGILGSLENNLCRFLSIYTGRATTICRPHIQTDLGRIWQKWGWNIWLDTRTCTRVQTRAQTQKHTEAKGARDVCVALIGQENIKASTNEPLHHARISLSFH